jgi:hypothetical protein
MWYHPTQPEKKDELKPMAGVLLVTVAAENAVSFWISGRRTPEGEQ